MSQLLQRSLLVVDNEEIICAVISETFEEAGWITYRALSGSSGLDLSHKFRPDVILADIKMADVDGLQMLKTLAVRKEMPKLFYFMSAFREVTVLEAQSLGARGIIEKPFSLQTLYELICKDFEKH